MKVRDLLSDESKWCKGPTAVDKEGNPTFPLSSTACKWCLAGAIAKCYAEGSAFRDTYRTPIDKITNIIHEIHGSSRRGTSYVTFNEASETTFAEIREILERADV
jgi:hypothetical protein